MLFFKNKHLAFEENKAWLENKNLPLRNIKDHKIDQLLKKFYQKYLDHYQTFSFLKQKPYSPNLLNMVQRLLNQNKDVYYQNDQFNKWGYKVSEFVGVKDLFDYEYKSGY